MILTQNAEKHHQIKGKMSDDYLNPIHFEVGLITESFSLWLKSPKKIPKGAKSLSSLSLASSLYVDSAQLFGIFFGGLSQSKELS